MKHKIILEFFLSIYAGELDNQALIMSTWTPLSIRQKWDIVHKFGIEMVVKKNTELNNMKILSLI